MTERTERMSEVIRRELSTLMARENLLEGLILTISSVETSPDMKHAYVYISMIEQAVSRGKALSLLGRCKSEWQAELGKRISSKFTPRLHFEFDTAQERGDKVMTVLQEIEAQKEREEALKKQLEQ